MYRKLHFLDMCSATCKEKRIFSTCLTALLKHSLMCSAAMKDLFHRTRSHALLQRAEGLLVELVLGHGARARFALA